MDAPNSCNPTTNSNTENQSLQESPIFKYISNLSPIPAEKGTPVAQGFPELTSSAVSYKSPKLCPRRKSSFTKRGLTPGLTATVIESANPHFGLYTSLNSYNERSSHSHSSEVSQIRGFTQYPDELLDHVGNTASLDPKASSDMTTVDKSESVDQPPYSLIVSTDFVPKSDCGFTGRACEEITVIPPAVTPETEEGHKISTSIDVSAIEYGVQQGDNVSIHQLPKGQFNVPAAPVNQDQESMIKDEESGQAHNFDQPYDFLPEYIQIDKENENSLEAAGAVWTGPEELGKAFQKPYLPRRSLLFEDSTHCDHPVNRPSVSGAKRSLSLEAPLAHIGSELQENFQPTYPSSLKPTTITAKPSGIGLHLNSIVHTVKDRAGAVVNVVKSAQRANNICTQEKEPIPLTHSHLFHSTNSSPPFLPTESVYELGDTNMHLYASCSSSRCMLRPSNTSAMVSTVDNQLPPSTKRKYSCETDNGSEARSKERKNSSDTNDGNSCQRCNCKKSQCLKLYCDCFAAGIYCAEPCACQGCYNRPEYDDTVNERRLQIQSRNPLAFASKIDVGIQFTPSSARHKRGCNCKRSMCVKKYCECYQAKVGCSDGCRCQGCINTFGRKGGEYLKDKDLVTEKCITETTDGGFIETMAESGNDLYCPDLVNPHNLTPVTPEVQFWKTDSSKGWLDSAQCLLGPSYASPYVMNTGSPANLENSGTISQAPYKVQSLLRSDEKLYSDAACHIATISPQLGNTGNLIDKVSSAVEDEAPDILNHCLTQSVAVQVSSPNKKRVSPPHILQHKHGSTSVGGGAVGRRFILKSVPSFPPISRHLDFKKTSPEQEQGKHPQCNKDQT